MCESFAPEVFEVQPDGSLVLLTDEPPEGMSKAVRAAAESCPVEAISLEELGHTS
jgi:ferredoxin